MSLIHLARQGFITKSALPNVTRQRGTTTGTANLMIYGAGKTHSIGTNTTFTDSSTNNFTVTRNGDTIQATNNPFTGSVYFDGNGDYLTVPNNTALNPGTGDFTLEVWVYFNTLTQGNIFDGNTNGMSLALDGSNRISFGQSNVAYLVTDTVAMTTGSWFHIVAVRSGTTLSLFKNGSRVATATNSSNFTTGTINRIGWNGFSAYFDGYLSNLRIVKGTAVYSPSSTTITVPTSPLTAITNTQLLLLTAQQAPFRDSSTNNFTVTANGNAAGSGLEPFPVNYAGSGYFDGNGDYLITNVASTQFDFDTGDFTIETWVYPIATGTAASETYLPICGADGSFSPNTSNWSFLYAVTGGNRLVYSTYENGVGYFVQSNTYTPTFNVWQHWACVRSGGVITFYVNGVSIGGGSFTRNQSYNNKLVVGVMYGGQPAKTVIWYSTMYLSNLRILKGTAQYTANFTPPAAPLTAVTNTSLLLLTNNVGPFVDTSANGFPVLRNGDTVQTGFSPFTGQPSAGSGYFDGTGDYLTSSLTSIGNFGTGDFTVECWIYASSTATLNIIDFRGSAGTGDGFRLAFGSTAGGTANKVIAGWGTSDQVLVATNIANTGQWYHVAVTRSGTTARLFIDGVQNSSATNSVSIPDSGLIVGSYRGTTAYYQGYISNLRVIKGTALYTSNFTPATAPLPAVPNTSLLLNTDNYTIANSTPTYLPVTVNGNTTISTAQYPTGMNRSIYFDGSGDYLTVPYNSTSFQFPADFTIECWVNLTSKVTAYPTILGNYSTYAVNGGFGIFAGHNSGTAGKYNIAFNGSFPVINSTTSISYGTWQHIALVRSGSTLTLYIDGVSNGTSTQTATVTGTANNWWIGTTGDDIANGYLNGYISNLRVVKGSALYTANFTPPSLPMSLSVTVPAFVTNNIYGVYQLA